MDTISKEHICLPFDLQDWKHGSWRTLPLLAALLCRFLHHQSRVLKQTYLNMKILAINQSRLPTLLWKFVKFYGNYQSARKNDPAEGNTTLSAGARLQSGLDYHLLIFNWSIQSLITGIKILSMALEIDG